LTLILIGCSQQITCNKPYILVGNECCLDKDDNSICDEDDNQPQIEPDQEVKETEQVTQTNLNQDKEEEKELIKTEEPKLTSANFTLLRLDGEGDRNDNYKFNRIELSIKNEGETEITNPSLELIAEKVTPSSVKVVSKSTKELEINLGEGKTVELVTEIPELFVDECLYSRCDITISLKNEKDILYNLTKTFTDRYGESPYEDLENPEIPQVLTKDFGYDIWVEDVYANSQKNSALLNTIIIGLEESDFYVPRNKIQEPVVDIFINGNRENIHEYNKISSEEFKGISLIPGSKITKEIPVSFKMDDDIEIDVQLRDGTDPKVWASKTGITARLNVDEESGLGTVSFSKGFT